MEKGDKPKVKISKVKKDKVKKSKKPKEKKPKKARSGKASQTPDGKRSVKRAKKTKKMIGADSKPMGAENPAEYKQPSRQMSGTTASGGGVSNFTGQMQIKAPEVKPKRKYTKKPKMETMAQEPAQVQVQEAVKRGRGRPKGSKNTTKETGKISEIMYLEPKEKKAELKEQQLQQQATPITKKELAEIVEPNLPSAQAPKEEKRPKGRPKKEKMIVEEKKEIASKKSKKQEFTGQPSNFLAIERDRPFDEEVFLNNQDLVEGTLGQKKKTTMKSKTYKSSSSESGFSEVEKITGSGFQDQNNVIATSNNSLTELMNENIKDGPDIMHTYENELDPKIDPSEIGDQVYPEYRNLTFTSSSSSGSSGEKKRGRPLGSKNQSKNEI
jgi:hypothetical protein